MLISAKVQPNANKLTRKGLQGKSTKTSRKYPVRSNYFVDNCDSIADIKVAKEHACVGATDGLHNKKLCLQVFISSAAQVTSVRSFFKGEICVQFRRDRCSYRVTLLYSGQQRVTRLPKRRQQRPLAIVQRSRAIWETQWLAHAWVICVIYMADTEKILLQSLHARILQRKELHRIEKYTVPTNSQARRPSRPSALLRTLLHNLFKTKIKCSLLTFILNSKQTFGRPCKYNFLIHLS